MKKWQIEGVCHRIVPGKLILPSPGQTAFSRSVVSVECRQESKFVCCCRHIAAFFIRFF